MALKIVINPARPPLDVLVVAEIIKFENKRDIIISWDKPSEEDSWGMPVDVCLYDEDDQKLAEHSNQISRYLARAVNSALYGGTCPQKITEVDQWLSWTFTFQYKGKIDLSDLDYLNKELITRTWLANKRLTLADIHVFSVLHNQEYIKLHENDYCNISRWYKHMQSLPVFSNAISMIAKNCPPSSKPKEKTTAKQTKTRKQEGKFIDLPGAEMGKVVVRFPPEASGYLHIGHAKAALLNQYYAEAFQGQLIVRFDDTNPAKETVEFEEAILEDLRLLQINADRFTHTSDYFEILQDYCTTLIKNGKAYVDGTSPNLMKEQRDQRVKSTYRDNSVADNLTLWEEMKRGTKEGQKYCVRAKIDYQSANGCMRDPTIYRCKPESHPHTGDKYKVYPTYDFACPIVDAIENVTHTLRTTEYHDRDVQFYWIIETLGLRRPYIWEYSRLNMTHTVLSKRKLTWFVNKGLVDGWDDPRFPTVRGILRRGMTVEGLKQFIIAQGSSRSVVFMEWDKIWAFNKKVIDPIAVRYTALDYEMIPVNVLDAKEEWLNVQNHPKDSSKGTKRVRVGPKILIEKEDAKRLIEGQNATFINWGNLMIIKINIQAGNVVNVEARLNLEDKNYKNTLKITWLAESLPSSDPNAEMSNPIKCYAVYFDHILSVPILGKDDDFENFVTKDTRKEVQMLGEVELKRVKKGEIIQLQRKGFFICDVPYTTTSPYSLRETPIVLFHIPDGHTTTPYMTPAVSRDQQKDKMQCVNNQDKNEEIVYRNPIEKLEETIARNGQSIVLNPKYKEAIKNVMKKAGETLKIPYDEVSGTLRITKDSLLYSPYLKEKNHEFVYIDAKDYFNHLLSRHTSRKTLFYLVIELIFEEIGYTMKINDETYINGLNESLAYGERQLQHLKDTNADKERIDMSMNYLEDINKEMKRYNLKKAGIVTYPDHVDPEVIELFEKCQKQGYEEKYINYIHHYELDMYQYIQEAYQSLFGVDWIGKVDRALPLAKRAQLISERIQAQNMKRQALIEKGAESSIIDRETKVLLNLKIDYKSEIGQDWKPDTTVSTESKTEPENKEISAMSCMEAEISKKIKEQGDKVRNLKSSKADKSIIDQEVKLLLSLKSEYKFTTGKAWKPANSEAASKKEKENSPKPGKTEKEVARNADGMDAESKTGTRLGLEAKKEESFSDWYSQVITKSGMIEYYDVSGCYILRPWSFSIWKMIKEYIDKEITALGVQECYFPIFVTRDVLEKEKAHITDFAPEVAWVTKSGESDLPEPIAIRPTSETVMYPAYAKWLRSDSELPLRLNQWNNVVRWEFKDPTPFLRTREFLWQEGHSAFATQAEAEEEVLTILDIYANVYEKLLAVPVIKGRKTEKEKFAGGDYTTTVEAFIPTNGRGIQGATSHHLGQNFSKMFNIQVEGIVDGEKTFVYQNSWGLTTRTIGVMIMVHGDDKGLVLPPNVAPIQVVVIPCGIVASMSASQKQELLNECASLVNQLKKGKIRVHGDFRTNRTPGWKFNHWELKGVPIRIEFGPRDIARNVITLVQRNDFERRVIERDELMDAVSWMLEDVQKHLLRKAKHTLNTHIELVERWNNFKGGFSTFVLDQKKLLLSPFCGEPSCEDNIKKDSTREDKKTGEIIMGAKSLCIPFEQPELSIPINKINCIHPTCKNKAKFYTLFGRSY